MLSQRKRGVTPPCLFYRMIYQKAYLCGHFTSTHVSDLTKQILKCGWVKSKDIISETEREVYYYSFQEFMFSKSMTHGCYSFNKTLSDEFVVGDTHVFLRKLQLFILPLNVVLFSINIEISSENVKNICSLMRRLRNCRNYGSLHKKWKEKVVAPLKEVCQFLTGNKNASYIDLVENSDRLKIMRIVWSDGGFEKLETSDRHKLLYNLCTDDWKTDADGLSVDENSEYIESMYSKHSLHIFKDWEVLSLSNSFTVLYKNKIDSDEIANIAHPKMYDYWDAKFRVLYIYALFQKCYLFKLNNSHLEIIKKNNSRQISNKSFFNFLSIKNDTSALTSLTKEYSSFENRYVFRNLSYNTFTSTLYSSMYDGLEIEKERQEISRVIKSEKQEEDAANSKKLNIVLLLLSLFTMFSAILAAGQLLDNIIPFDSWLPNTNIGYLLVTILVIVTFYFFAKRFSNEN